MGMADRQILVRSPREGLPKQAIFLDLLEPLTHSPLISNPHLPPTQIEVREARHASTSYLYSLPLKYFVATYWYAQELVPFDDGDSLFRTPVPFPPRLVQHQPSKAVSKIWKKWLWRKLITVMHRHSDSQRV
jgi:hypothetical protein